MKDLLNLLLEGNYTIFMIIVSIIIFVWLFKDIKKSLLETKKSDLDFLNESINSHAQALKTIHFFFYNSIDEYDLLSNLYSSYKYFDQSIIEKINYLMSCSSILTPEKKSYLLIDLSKEIKNNLHSLKNMQLHPTIKKKYTLSTFEFFYMVTRNNFDIYFNAFLYSMIILIIFLTILDISLESATLDPIRLIMLIICVITFIFWLFLTSISIDLLIRRHYKKPLLFILFFLLPFILAYFIKICPYSIGKLFLVIIFSISVIISFFINVKYSKEINARN